MMKNLTKRIGAIVLTICMVLSMVVSVSAATYKLTLTFSGYNARNEFKKITASSASLGENDSLATAVYQLVASETKSEHKSSHLAHIASREHNLCTEANCGLYQLWSVELDALFDVGKAEYNNSEAMWRNWVDNFTGESGADSANLVSWLRSFSTTIGSSVGGANAGKTFTMYYNATSGKVYTMTVKATTEGSGGGPGGGTGSMTTTETITNPDGSVTTIITDKNAGTVTEITTTTGGITATTVTVNGQQSVTEVIVPDGTAEPIKLPDPIKNKDVLDIDLPEGGGEVVIPVQVDKPGNVVVIVHPDGTEEVVKGTNLTTGGVVVTLDGDAKVKVVDKSKTFVDMVGHWANNAVDYVAARGLFAGTGDGTTFSPEVPMTRGMLAQVIYNLEGAEKHNYVHGFTDIPAGQWYTAAVNWAAREDVVAGYGDGSYKPNKILSREEFAQILYNYAKALGYDVNKTADLSTFADGDEVSWWATAAMQWAVSTGLISGKGGNILGATHTATRAEGAQMFMNFMEKIINN